jgi:hypothetical protein
VAGGTTPFEQAHDVTNGEVAGEHHGEAPSPASEYLALAQLHEGDAGQALHGSGHDQGASDYTQMTGNVMPPDEHHAFLAPDQLFAETGTAHGPVDASHDLQPMQHEDAAAAHVPAMETPVEADQGHHG